LEVACEPNGRVGTKSELVDHLVPPAIDIPEVYRMVSSRLVSVWTLYVRVIEGKVEGCEEFHRDSETVCAGGNAMCGWRGVFAGF
jgi:hypothetical protein